MSDSDDHPTSFSASDFSSITCCGPIVYIKSSILVMFLSSGVYFSEILGTGAKTYFILLLAGLEIRFKILVVC